MKLKHFPKDCSEIIKEKVIVLEDEGISKRLLNPKEEKIEKITIDGRAITEGYRCDFLLLCKGYSKAHFFEFKHKSGLHHAFIQLETTMENLTVKSLVGGLKKHCWIVTPVKRLPTGPELAIIKKKYSDKFDAKFNYVEPDPSPPLSLV